MRWFLSYLQVYTDGRFMFGARSYQEDIHPLAKVAKWNAEYGMTDKFKIVAISFFQVGDDCPEVDDLSNGIS